MPDEATGSGANSDNADWNAIGRAGPINPVSSQNLWFGCDLSRQKPGF